MPEIGSPGAANGVYMGSSLRCGAPKRRALILDRSLRALRLTTALVGVACSVAALAPLLVAVPAPALAGTLYSYANGVDDASPIVLNSDSQLEVLNADAATQSGMISETGGPWSVEKTGTGTLTLSGANTYSGGTTITAGTLTAASDSAFGTGPVTLAGGVLSLTGTHALANAIGLSKLSTIRFNTGAIGTLNGNITTNGQALTLDTLGTDATGTINGDIIGSSSLITKSGLGTVTVNGVISGIGAGLAVTDGTIVLNGANTYGGNTLLTHATLVAGADKAFSTSRLLVMFDGALSANKDVSLNNAVDLWYDHRLTVDTAGHSIAMSGVIRDQSATTGGSLTKTGSGTLTLTGANTYSGGTNLYGGTISVGNNSALGINTSRVYAYGNTIDIQDGITLSNPISLGTNLNLNVASGATGTYAGQVDNGAGDPSFLVKTGGGVLILTNSNAPDLGAILHEGTVRVDVSNALGPAEITLDGGTLQAGAAALTLLNRGIFMNAPGGTIDTNGFDLTFNGPIQNSDGPGQLTKIGTGTFWLGGTAGGSTYSGPTVVSAGTFAAAGTNTFSANSALTIAAGATLDLGGYSQETGSLTGGGSITNSGAAGATLTTNIDSGTATFGGVIGDGTGVLSLTKTGAGTQILSNINTYTGASAIQAGTLALSGIGSIAASSGVAVAGTLDVSQTAGGTSLKTLSGAGTVALGSKTLTITSGSGTFAGVIADGGLGGGTGGGLTLTGGMQTLSGANTYTGATTVSGGTLTISGSVARDVTNNSVLVLANGGDVGGALANNAFVTVLGAGGSTVTGLLTNYGTVGVNAGATLAASGGIDNKLGATINNNGTINDDLSNAGVVTNNAVYNAKVASNSGTIWNNAAGTWTGDVGDGANTGTINNNGVWNGNVLGATGNAGIINTTGTWNGSIVNSATLTASGQIAGDVTNNTGSAFSAGGALSVTGLLTNNGATTGLGGNIVSVGGLAGSASAATLGNGTFAFGGDNASRTYAGRFIGVGTISKTGSGTETLTGVNGTGAQFNGTFDIGGGKVLVNGTLGDTAANAATINVNAGGVLGGSGVVAGRVQVVGGTLAPGNSSGTLTIAGDLTLGPASTAAFELGQGGVAGGADNDLVKVGGNATLGGTARLTATGGGQVQSGYYNLMQVAGTVSGNFATVDAGTATANIYTTTVGGPFRVNTLVANAGQSVQFWDGADEVGVAGVAGGTGTFDAVRTNWTANPDGSDPLAPGGAGVNDHWREGVGVFAVAGGTVTTSGTLGFQGLQFIVDGYTVNGPGTLNMTGDAPAGAPAASFINVEGPGNTATIDATISGNAGIGLSKAGAGTLVLTGANTYTGGTRLVGGTLSVSNDGNLGAASGALTFDGGTLQNTAAMTSARNITLDAGGGTFLTKASLALSGTISGSGSLTKTGLGTLLFSGAGTYSGGTTVSAGILQLGDAADAGSIAGSVTVGTNGYVYLVNSTIPGVTTIGNSGFMVLSNASTLGSATVSGNGGIEFLDTASAGTAQIAYSSMSSPLRFFNSSTAGHATITNSGFVQFSDSSTAGSAVIANSQGVGFFDTSTAGSAAITNDVNGYVEFLNGSSAGGATITNNGELSFNGTATAGTATISNAANSALSFFNASTAANAAITNSGFISFGQTYSTDTVTAGGATIVNNSGGELDFNGLSSAGNASIVTNGGGYTAFFDKSAGGQAAFLANAGGVVDFSATLGANGDGKISAGSLAGAGTYYLGSNQLTVGGTDASATVTGTIGDCGPTGQECYGGGTGGSLVKVGTGTLTFAGTNSYSGGTTVAAGTLQVGDGGTAGSIIGNVNVAPAGTLAFNRSDSFGFAGALSGMASRPPELAKPAVAAQRTAATAQRRSTSRRCSAESWSKSPAAGRPSRSAWAS